MSMPTYPGARVTLLGSQRQAQMSAHDLVIIHTMVGYLVSTDHYFRVTNGLGFVGTESHCGIGGKWGPDFGDDLDGAVLQWQDFAYTADANLEGAHHALSVETADNAPASPGDIEAWTAKQVDALARLIAWWCAKSTHAGCPSSWKCHQEGIPLKLVDNSLPGARGVAYHKQGIDPWRVAGGEHWSTSYGKECPGARRIAQIPHVIELAIALSVDKPTDPAPPTQEDDDMQPFISEYPGGGQYAVRGDLSSRVGIASGTDRAVLVAMGYEVHNLTAAQLDRIPVADATERADLDAILASTVAIQADLEAG